jgi:YNFM family putative membrane transporter
MGTVKKDDRDFRRIAFALFAAGFVTFITLYDVQPLLPIFSREFDISAAAGSLPLSAATITMGVMMLLAGTLSETWGRKRIMTWAMALTSICALLTAFTGNFLSLVVLRLIQGMALAGVPAVAMAYLSEEMDAESLSAAMGLYIAGNAAGGMTGRIATAIIADNLSWRLALGIMGILCIAATIYFARELPASKNFTRRPFQARYLYTSLMQNLRMPSLRYLYAIVFMLMGSFVTLYNYITFHLLGAPYNLNHTLVSWIFLSYIFGSISSTLSGNMVKRFGRQKLLRITLSLALCGALLTLLSHMIFVVTGIVMVTIGFFGAHTIASSWVGAIVKTARAQASSLYLFFYYLGGSIMGTLGGLFWSAHQWPGVVALISALLSCAIVLTFFLGRCLSRGDSCHGIEVSGGHHAIPH